MNKKKIFIGIGTILILIILVCLLVVLKNRNIKNNKLICDIVDQINLENKKDIKVYLFGRIYKDNEIINNNCVTIMGHLNKEILESIIRAFNIFSKKYDEIADRIIKDADRGVTVLDGTGWYSKNNVKVLVVLAKKRQSLEIFRLVKRIDPNAFISQSSVIGVYGEGFDKLKVK